MAKKVKKRGPKSKYDAVVYPQLCKWMARGGLTEIQIAAELGISYKQFKVWKLKYKEIGAALKQPKNFIDSLVEDSLLKRANGYEYEEVTEIDGPEGHTHKVVKKQMAPDPVSCFFWLKNRQSKIWRDKILEFLKDGAMKELADALGRSLDKK